MILLDHLYLPRSFEKALNPQRNWAVDNFPFLKYLLQSLIFHYLPFQSHFPISFEFHSNYEFGRYIATLPSEFPLPSLQGKIEILLIDHQNKHSFLWKNQAHLPYEWIHTYPVQLFSSIL